MFESFITYIQQKADFTQPEIDQVLQHAFKKKIRKRQFLLHEGETARHKCFISEGLLRLYRIREDGSEHILKFGAENWWLTDMESYNHQVPTKTNIDALEDTEVILWTKDNFDELLRTVPALKLFSENLISKSYDAAQNRLFSNIGYSAEEKYDEFIRLYPDLFNRLSLQTVGSYLGISRETLSRIRNGKTHKH